MIFFIYVLVIALTGAAHEAQLISTGWAVGIACWGTVIATVLRCLQHDRETCGSAR